MCTYKLRKLYLDRICQTKPNFSLSSNNKPASFRVKIYFPKINNTYIFLFLSESCCLRFTICHHLYTTNSLGLCYWLALGRYLLSNHAIHNSCNLLHFSTYVLTLVSDINCWKKYFPHSSTRRLYHFLEMYYKINLLSLSLKFSQPTFFMQWNKHFTNPFPG